MWSEDTGLRMVTSEMDTLALCRLCHHAFFGPKGESVNIPVGNGMSVAVNIFEEEHADGEYEDYYNMDEQQVQQRRIPTPAKGSRRVVPPGAPAKERPTMKRVSQDERKAAEQRKKRQSLKREVREKEEKEEKERDDLIFTFDSDEE